MAIKIIFRFSGVGHLVMPLHIIVSKCGQDYSVWKVRIQKFRDSCLNPLQPLVMLFDLFICKIHSRLDGNIMSNNVTVQKNNIKIIISLHLLHHRLNKILIWITSKPAIQGLCLSCPSRHSSFEWFLVSAKRLNPCVRTVKRVKVNVV